MKQITDTDRINWLQQGHGVVALANAKEPNKPRFTANFEEQDWDESEDVREAIDVAMARDNK